MATDDLKKLAQQEAPSPFTSGMSGYIRVKPPNTPVERDTPQPDASTPCPLCADAGTACDIHQSLAEALPGAPYALDMDDYTAEGQAAIAYQICGALGAPARILDYFSAVASGERPPNPLPFVDSPVASQGPRPVADSLSTLWDGNSLPLSPGEKIAYRGIAQTVWDAAQKSQAEEIARLRREVESERSIKEAEKKILVAEVEENERLARQLIRARAILTEQFPDIHQPDLAVIDRARAIVAEAELARLQTEIVSLKEIIDNNPYRKMVLEHIASFPSGHITDRLHEVDGAEIARLTEELSRLTAEEKK